MGKPRITQLVLVITALFLLQPSIPARSSGELDCIPDEVRRQFLQLDFSDVLAECKQYPMGDPAYQGQWQPEMILLKELTPAERKMVSTFRDQDAGIAISPAYTGSYVFAYREIYGTMPRDGVDLLVMTAPMFLTEKGWNKFAALSKTAQTRIVAVAINPATGKFYDTFTRAGWKAFGMRLDKQRGPGSRKKDYVPIHNKADDTWTPVLYDHQAWQTTIYGERKGTVLVKAVAWQILDGKATTSTPPKAGCGCKGKK